VDSLAHIQFHSSLNNDAWQRPLGPPTLLLRGDSPTHATLLSPAGGVRTWTDPLAALDWMGSHFPDEDSRWAGYLSYDLGRLFEKFSHPAPDDLNLPLFVFTLHRMRETPHAEPVFPAAPPISAPRLRSNFTRSEYLAAVQRAIDYIAAGDIFQVNLSQRFSARLPMPPRQIWRNLLEQSPAPYGALLDYGDHALISNSPELFLRVTPDRRIQTRPIKGTRPRLLGMDRELFDSAKDRAELNMIIDLERNDLGRICQIGSVKVTEPRTIESHPTVYHGVATIEGILRDNMNFIELLASAFPGGSITGAPKIRAMQIIDELEKTRRGPYCGAIGYLDADGSMQFNVAIRTMIATRGQIHIPVGGGIVADSLPIAEYEETLVKARAMFAALGASGEVRATSAAWRSNATGDAETRR
jgi:anthranilate/para-aminobenzoate synthase component I